MHTSKGVSTFFFHVKVCLRGFAIEVCAWDELCAAHVIITEVGDPGAEPDDLIGLFVGFGEGNWSSAEEFLDRFQDE
ncbi:hypothetical protein Ddc_11084 [Ditylenchus destructor]|nr:hypothetical protein Ddc_11084 [Ditylenchus destructor]